MANITITIPDASLSRIVADIAAAYNYQATINGAPNPQTQQAFAKAQIINWIKNTCKNQELSSAMQSAQAQASTTSSQIDTINIT